MRQLAERGYTAILGSRDSAKGERAATELGLDGVVAAPLDVSDDASVAAFSDWLVDEYGRCDVLVNNAAVDYDTDQRAVSADLARVRGDLDTNLFGAWRMIQALLPLLRQSDHPRVVNVSSGAGSLESMGGAGGRPVSDGAAGVVWSATLPDDGPTGGFFRDRRPVAW